jgi:hypothetical protein
VGHHIKLRSGNIFEALLFGDFIATPTPVIHRDVFARLGTFAALPTCEDWEMWLRIAQYYPVGLVHEPLARYRMSAGSMSQSFSTVRRHQVVIELLDRAIQRNPNVTATLANKALHNACLASAEKMIQQTAIPEARAVIRDAYRHHASAQALAYLALTYCPVDLQRTLRDIRRRIKGMPSLA